MRQTIENYGIAIILGSFIVAGFMHRFSAGLVAGIVGLTLIYFRRDFMPQGMRDSIDEKLEQSKEKLDYVVLEDKVERLQEKVNQLNATLAFKTGFRGKSQEPVAPAGTGAR